METVGWQDKIKRQLEVVQQWRQSGQSMAAWAAAHGGDAKLLMGWVSYEKRWRQKLAADPEQSRESRSIGPAAPKSVVKATAPAPSKARPKGFVAVRSSDAQALGSVASSTVANKANDCALGPVHPSAASVRVECVGAGLVLHWPLTHSTELTTWLQAAVTSSDALRPDGVQRSAHP